MLVKRENPANPEQYFHIDIKTGEVWTHLRVLANLCGVHASSIHRLCKKEGGLQGVALDSLKEAEVVTEGGLQGVALDSLKEAEVVTEGGLQGVLMFSETQVQLILEYYAFDAGRYCTDEAKQAIRSLFKLGYRVAAHQAVGYIHIEKRSFAYTERLEYLKCHLVKTSHEWFTVIEETQALLRDVETKYPVSRLDLLDGSVGLCWANYRVKVLGLERDKAKANAMYKVWGEDYPTAICAYSLDELPVFRRWLYEEYVPSKLPKYLESKYASIVKA